MNYNIEQLTRIEVRTGRAKEMREGWPHFIIGGAQKSGTTSLHYILNQHPSVFIPGNELHFFAIDDPQETVIGAREEDKKRYSWENHFQTYSAWYRRHFEAAGAGTLIGEDSTTYLSSTLAPQRIARILPDVKLIFILRDPVARTYSHYWHRVRTGREVTNFKQSIKTPNSTLIRRSLYHEQLQRYLAHFPRETIKVVIFEEFVAHPQATIDSVLDFLELDRMNVSLLKQHYNPSKIPKNVQLQLYFNRLSSKRLSTAQLRLEPYTLLHRPKISVDRQIGALFRIINPLVKRPYPPLDAETKSQLRTLYQPGVAKLSDLLQIDLNRIWQ